ncbi:MAG: hypothetical protein KJN90_04205, partial [Gammaproteobacteria bacterium]|nr:hypothetical protein [Gammaproteobacteria bacterium]
MVSQVSLAAQSVPNEVQLPGTQPQEIADLESPEICTQCHGGYDADVEPVHNWRGSMMSHAGRDPIFWATMAIAEQDFDGAGDLCIRCHSTAGWLAGRSTPTDGSGLIKGDSDGVECSYCHKLTNTDDSEHLGVMNVPFLANETSATGETEGYYGSGMASLYAGTGVSPMWGGWGMGSMGGGMGSMWVGTTMLGPYDDARARHKFLQSDFHRDRNFCGTCHDVSNPVTGDLAHNFGALFNKDEIVASGVPGEPVDQKAAFNNPPYRYGIVERTFSEYQSGLVSKTLVDDYLDLPPDLQGGVLEAVYNATYNESTGTANYQNPPADRYFSCQTCHMRPVTGKGARMHDVPVRTDLPLHDLTGGNYWMASAIEYLNDKGKLRLGGDMTARQIQAMKDGALRAEDQLRLAASLAVDGNMVKIVNHTGHKLISGYPEGRRMWLHIEWFDEQGQSIREDGAYGEINVSMDDNPLTVRSIVDLSAANTRVYEAHMGMTQEWASQLVALNVSPELPLKYDRLDGSVKYTLGDLAAMPTGTSLPTFHFVLNNTVISDNRIPPYGMNAEEARRRNAAPVSEDTNEVYIVDDNGNYPYYDLVDLNPPVGAVSADIELLYQPTSWEYIQFLNLANDGSSEFLGSEGDNMLEAWLSTGMAEPFVMTSAKWNVTEQDCTAAIGSPEGNDDCQSPIEAGVSGLETGQLVRGRPGKKARSAFRKTTDFSVGDTVVIRLQVLDSDGE